MPLCGTLILIGLRGSGKSTLGARLAERLSIEFLDLDELVSVAMGSPSAGDAITTHGVAAFREAETRSLKRALDERPGSVLALGGGTPTAPGADDLLRKAQADDTIAVCYLRASPAVLAERLRSTETDSRPSLTGKGTIEEIEEVFEQRDGLYESLADHVIETDDLDETDTLDYLVKWSEACP